MELLKTVQQKSREEKGNLYSIYQRIAEGNTIVLHEGYSDGAAIIKHRNSAHYQELVVGNHSFT